MRTILVTYASKHGATAEIAQSIARVLRSFELDVTARRVENIESLSEFDAVVMGSAIYLGEWIDTSAEFLERYQADLEDKAIWFFISGPTGEGDPLNLLKAPLVPDSIRATVDAINPVEVKLFKGKIDLRRLPPDQRKIVKAANVPRGDFRDWDVIQAWAKTLARTLREQSIIKKPDSTLMLLEE